MGEVWSSVHFESITLINKKTLYSTQTQTQYKSSSAICTTVLGIDRLPTDITATADGDFYILALGLTRTDLSEISANSSNGMD